MKITAIRLCYVAGAAADAAIGALLLFPAMLAEMLGLAETPTRISERIGLAMTATLLFGWTALLLWGARAPVERRGVLLLTIFPVIVGLALTVLYGWSGSYISTGGAMMVWSLQTLLAWLLAWAFISARRCAIDTGAAP
jgi:uncharacterized membrane protein